MNKKEEQEKRTRNPINKKKIKKKTSRGGEPPLYKDVFFMRLFRRCQ